MTSSFEDQNKLYSQLKAYSEKQLSSTPIITVRVEGAITEAGEVLAIFPQVFRFPAMPSFYHNLSLPMKFSPDARVMISWIFSRWTLPVGQINWLPPATSNTLCYSFIIVYADDFSSGASVSEYHHKVTFSLRSSLEIESSDIMVFTRRV